MPEVLRSAGWWRDPAPRVSVAVSTWGRAAFLPGLVRALEQQTGAPSYEVVVADNGSADGTWEQLRELVAATPLSMTAVRLPVNAGAGAGRDGALAHCRGGLVAFTDDDCLPTPGWLRALAAPLAEPDVAVVQGRTEPEAPTAPGRWARSVWVTGPTPWLETCNIAYRRDAVLAAGGFGSGRRPGGRAFGEDTLLGHRVLAAGGRQVFAADAVVRHRWLPGTFGDHLAERRLLRGFPAIAAEAPAFAAHRWGGVFLSRRTAAVDLAAASLLLAGAARRPVALLGVLPWLRTAWGPARARGGRLPVRLVQAAVADLVGLGALLRGSAEARRLLL